jgi:hypothetical protein
MVQTVVAFGEIRIVFIITEKIERINNNAKPCPLDG